jgi:hypothetical protein
MKRSSADNVFGAEWFINGTYTVTANKSLFLVSDINLLHKFSDKTLRDHLDGGIMLPQNEPVNCSA